MVNLVVFAPNGYGDLVMLSPFLRKLAAEKVIMGVVVKSPKHKELLEELGVLDAKFFFVDTRSKFSVFLLFLKFLWLRPFVVAPFLSSKKTAQLVLSLSSKKVFLPNKVLTAGNLVEIESQFDQRGKRHLIKYLEDAFQQAHLLDRNYDALKEIKFSVGNNNVFEKSKKKRVLVCLSCGIDERHKIPDPEVFAKFLNSLDMFDTLEIICVGVQSDLIVIDAFLEKLHARYAWKKYIDLNFSELRALMTV
jgi:ADP-heptose:LPS heptosyltransferase